MIELIINDELITGLDEIRLTKAVNDLGDLPSRQGEYSVTLTAPPTKSNYLAFGMIEQINNLSRVPKQINTYYLYESGVLVSNGTARILSIKNGIEFVLLSNNSDWVGLLEDRSLRDLDVSENDYSLIPSAVASRRLNTTQMCLPNVYYNFKDVARPYDVFDFKPCFYLKYLIEKMFNIIGYTLVNQMNTTDLEVYEKILTIPSEAWLQQSYLGISFKAKTVTNGSVQAINLGTPTFLGGDKCYTASPNDVQFLACPISGKNNQVDVIITETMNIKTTFIKPKKIVGYVDINVTVTQTTPQTVSVNFYKPDFPIATIDFPLSQIIVTNAGDYRINFDIDITDPSILPNPNGLDTFIGVECSTWFTTGLGDCNVVVAEITVYDDGYVGYPQLVSTQDEFVADTSGCLPDMKQTDLLRTVVNQFMLLLTTNTLTKEVFFIPLDTVIENIPNAIDWSDRVDLTEEHEIIYNFFDNYSQRNWMRYKDDEKDTLIAGTGYGSFYFDYDNENVPLEGDVLTSEFSAIAREDISGKTIASCKFYPNETFNPKLGVSKITTDNLITQFGQSAPAQSNEIFFDDIAFANLIPNNYQALQRILNNGIAIKMLMRLTRADFTNMDFSVPVFLDVVTQKGHVRGHFYVNQISQYNVGAHDSCEVTLIQID